MQEGPGQGTRIRNFRATPGEKAEGGKKEEEEEGEDRCSWADPEEEKGQGDPLSHPRKDAQCRTTAGAGSTTRSCPGDRGAEAKHG